MKKAYIGFLTAAAISLLPIYVFAVDQFAGNPFPVERKLDINSFLGAVFAVLWPIVVAIVIIGFILAGFKFVMAQGEPGKVAEARKILIWSVAGAAVIMLAFSMITLVRMTLGI